MAKHLHVNVYKHTYTHTHKCQTQLSRHVQCEGNKVDKHRKCSRGMLMSQTCNLSFSRKNTHIHKHGQLECIPMHGHARTYSHTLSLSTQTLGTLNPPTLCKCLATAPINLDETTQWQGEAFIPFPGGQCTAEGPQMDRLNFPKTPTYL